MCFPWVLYCYHQVISYLLLKQNRWNNWYLVLKFSSLGMILVALSQKFHSLSRFFLSSGHQDLYHSLLIPVSPRLTERASPQIVCVLFTCSQIVLKCCELQEQKQLKRFLCSSAFFFVFEEVYP